jgi:hypothetical protein
MKCHGMQQLLQAADVFIIVVIYLFFSTSYKNQELQRHELYFICRRYMCAEEVLVSQSWT